jgi:hypothetical protein
MHGLGRGVGSTNTVNRRVRAPAGCGRPEAGSASACLQDRENRVECPLVEAVSDSDDRPGRQHNLDGRGRSDRCMGFGRSHRSRLVPRDGTTAAGCVSMMRNGLSSAQALVPGRATDAWQGRSSARPDHHRGRGGRGRQSNLAASRFPSASPCAGRGRKESENRLKAVFEPASEPRQRLCLRNKARQAWSIALRWAARFTP